MTLGGPQEVDTIFVGGGTPTRLEAAQLERLTGIIGRWFVLTPGGEWTFEANPGTLDVEKADILAAAGVDRISLGAQSFRPDSLAVLERQHGRTEVEKAVAIVGPRFPRWSLDLIFGVPGSSLDDWRRRPGDRDRVRPCAPLVLRPRLREGDGALETAGARRGPAPRRGARAVHVRGHHRSPGRVRPGDVRDLELRAAGSRVAAQPRLLGQRGVFRLRRRRGALCARGPSGQYARPPRVPPPDRSGRAGDGPERGAGAGGAGPARPQSSCSAGPRSAWTGPTSCARTGFEIDAARGPGHRAISGRGLPGRGRGTGCA